MFLGQLIGLLDPRAACGGAACLQVVDGSGDLCGVAARHAVQDYRLVSSVGDNGHPVPGVKVLGQHGKGFLDKRQFVVRIHGAGHVQQKYQVGGGTVTKIDLLCFEANEKETVFFIPGAGRVFRGDGEGVLTLRLFVLVVKIIQHLLDPDRVFWHSLAGADESSDVGVGGSVHVGGEGGQWFLFHRLEAALLNMAVLLRGAGVGPVGGLILSGHGGGVVDIAVKAAARRCQGFLGR